MSVKVKLKNLTTDLIEMVFNYVVPLIKSIATLKSQKMGFKLDISMSKNVENSPYYAFFRHDYIAPVVHFLTLECQIGLE